MTDSKYYTHAINFQDISGRSKNKWTVLRWVGDNKYLCRCICGTERAVRADSLKTGKSKGCGCRKEDNFYPKLVGGVLIDSAIKVGKRFGKLLVQRKTRAGRWWCICDCGVEKTFEGSELRNSDIGAYPIDCGCGKRARIAAVRAERAAARRVLTLEEGITRHGQLYAVWFDMIERAPREGAKVSRPWGMFERFKADVAPDGVLPYPDRGDWRGAERICRITVREGYGRTNYEWLNAMEDGEALLMIAYSSDETKATHGVDARAFQEGGRFYYIAQQMQARASGSVPYKFDGEGADDDADEW